MKEEKQKDYILSHNLKPTNPKDVFASKKVFFSVIPWNVIAKVSLALLEGARKYGRHNWRVSGVLASVYFDATLRHLTDWWEGRDLTPEGTHHIDNAMASLIVLRSSMLQGNWKDDRPPKTPSWLEEVNKEAANIIDRYPNPAPIHTELKVNIRSNSEWKLDKKTNKWVPLKDG